jgi:hypothetical protein
LRQVASSDANRVARRACAVGTYQSGASSEAIQSRFSLLWILWLPLATTLEWFFKAESGNGGR